MRYEYYFNNRYQSGNFDLNLKVIDEDGKVVKEENIFRTWNKPETKNDEWDFGDEIEKQSFSQLKYWGKNRNDELILRICLKKIFQLGAKWLKTGGK